MKTFGTAGILAITLSGCSFLTETQSFLIHELQPDECMYIGCETGGMVFYPHERPQDKNEPGENYEL